MEKTSKQKLFEKVVTKYYDFLYYKVSKFRSPQNIMPSINSSVCNFYAYNINLFDESRYDNPEDLFKGARNFFMTGFFKYFGGYYGKKIKEDIDHEQFDVNTENLFYGLYRDSVNGLGFGDTSSIMGRGDKIKRVVPLSMTQTLSRCIPSNNSDPVEKLMKKCKQDEEAVDNKIYLNQFIKFFKVLSIEDDKKDKIGKYLELKCQQGECKIDIVKKEDIFGTNFAHYRKILDKAHKKFNTINPVRYENNY